MFHNSYDYIIIGAGSAGCVLANRLSCEASRRVLLIEAGPKDWSPLIHIPAGFLALMKNTSINWCYQTETEPHMQHRKLDWPRGKVLGGSSSINGMVYTRGHQRDYDLWAEREGCEGWSWREVLPWFRYSEHQVNGESEHHGIGGLLWVDNPVNHYDVGDVFIQAAKETGIPVNEDFNTGDNEGVGYYQVNIRQGRRQSTAKTFLSQAKERPNLHIMTNALAEKIIFDGKRAVGVRYTQSKFLRKSKTINARASKEVILCGGSINSPQLLELSGIGNSEHLKAAGIKTKHELMGVGENLQDHLTINTYQGLKNIRTFYEETRPLGLLYNLAQYLFTKRGILNHPAAEVGCFFKSNPKLNRPDAQIHFTPATAKYNNKGVMKICPGVTATVCYLHPESRGSIHIKSKKASDNPVIKANYMSAEQDRKIMIALYKKVRSIYNSAAFKHYIDPNIECAGIDAKTDKEIFEYIQSEANSVYHPVGSCAMGKGPKAVVDKDLRVHGLQGLRISDASIIPELPSGNTNALAIMIAERCAYKILQEHHSRPKNIHFNFPVLYGKNPIHPTPDPTIPCNKPINKPTKKINKKPQVKTTVLN